VIAESVRERERMAAGAVVVVVVVVACYGLAKRTMGSRVEGFGGRARHRRRGTGGWHLPG
jgi:hypothetical protein